MINPDPWCALGAFSYTSIYEAANIQRLLNNIKSASSQVKSRMRLGARRTTGCPFYRYFVRTGNMGTRAPTEILQQVPGALKMNLGFECSKLIQCLNQLELNITLGSRKTEKKEYRVMIKKNENIYKLKTKMLTKGMERKEKNNYW